MYNKKNALGFTPKPSKPPARTLRRVSRPNIGEPSTRLPPPPKVTRVDYGDNQEEMEAREALAQKEIEFKKTCTAPAYNKGGYQYVSSEEQAKMIGR